MLDKWRNDNWKRASTVNILRLRNYKNQFYFAYAIVKFLFFRLRNSKIVTTYLIQKLRIHGCLKAAMFLYYPRMKCSFFRLESIMKKSEDPFIVENLEVMRDEMEYWQEHGKSFVKMLSRKFTTSEDREIEEQSPSLFDDSDEIDPALLQEEVLNLNLESQGSSDKLGNVRVAKNFTDFFNSVK